MYSCMQIPPFREKLEGVTIKFVSDKRLESILLLTDRIRSMGEGSVFTGVCHSVYRGGV